MKGLYVHVPFCARKCHYCDFVITTDTSRAAREKYFLALEREIDVILRRSSAEGSKASDPSPRHPTGLRMTGLALGVRPPNYNHAFDTLYLGGGTPSQLGSTEMERLFRMLRSAFNIRAGAEITCEVNPGDLSEEKLKIYTKLGINRISLGVQSFRDGLLSDMGRAHGVQATHDAFSMIRDSGIENVSADLILKLPGQTAKDVEDSLARVVSGGAKQVVLYDLAVHPGTVYGRRQKEGKLVLPTEELHEKMYAHAVEFLTNEGFRHYEVSSFARPGFESRHNLIYWHNEEYLGLGPGAFSYLGGRRYQYASSFARYLEKIAKDDWSNEEEDILTDKEKELESFLVGLRLEEGVCREDFPRVVRHLQNDLELLENKGLMESKKNLRLTPRGKALAETVFTTLSSKL